MGIHVDMRVRIIPDNHGVYLARPGEEYGLYEDFMDASAIGPEFPGMEIDRTIPILEQPNLDNNIKMARAIKEWVINGKRPNQLPSPNPSDHSDRRRSKGWPNYHSVLHGYFDRAQRGDLILIPQRSINSDVVLAEFTRRPRTVKYVKTRRYNDFLVPARPFRTLATMKKKDLSSNLIDLISKPNMLVLIGESERGALYNAAYGTYVSKGQYSTRIDIKSDTYSTPDNITLSAFINFIANNTRAVTADDESGTLGWKQAAFADLGEFSLALQASINSPGNITLRASLMTPLVVAVMFALAGCGEDVLKAAREGRITIGNTLAPPGDLCTAAEGEAAYAQLALDGLVDEWPEACERVRRTIEDTGLSVSPIISETENED